MSEETKGLLTVVLVTITLWILAGLLLWFTNAVTIVPLISLAAITATALLVVVGVRYIHQVCLLQPDKKLRKLLPEK